METSAIFLLIFIALSYFVMINVIYYLAPTVKHNEFPKKRFGKNNCTRIAENPNRGKNMEPIITKLSENEIQGKLKNIINNMRKIKIINEKLCDNEVLHDLYDIISMYKKYHQKTLILYYSSPKSLWKPEQLYLFPEEIQVHLLVCKSCLFFR